MDRIYQNFLDKIWQNSRSAIVYQASGVLVFVILGIVIYSNTLNSPFVFDDIRNIKKNHHIRLTELSLKNIKDAGFESPASIRPVANISFALNYYFHKYNLIGYHCTNITIHILTAILLYFFIKNTLSISSLRNRYGNYKKIAYFATLLWLVHPIQTQSVTYIVQRMNSLASMFYILSLLFYVKGRLANRQNNRSWPLFTGCILSGILAIGSKQIAATLPVFILIYEWYFFQDLQISWLKRYLIYVIVIFAAFGILALFYLGTNPLERILSSYKHRDFTLTERVLTQPRVVVYYISLLFYPHPSRLNLDYDFAISKSLISPVTTLPSIGVIIGLLVIAVYIAKRERLLSFCILWFFGNLAIESSFIGLELVFEHRLYLPSMLVSAAIAALAWRYIKQGWFKVSVFSIVIVLFSVWTYQRNNVWSDAVTLFRDCVAKSPNKARPHNNLGNVLVFQGKHNEAINHYRQALNIEPDYVRAHNNLANTLVLLGKPDEAINHYRQALHVEPDYVEARNNLANALAAQGRLDEAISHYRQILQLKPEYAEAHKNLANALANQGRFDEAVSHYRKALQLKPEYTEAHKNLANVLVLLGKLNEAIRRYRQTLQLSPDSTVSLNNLAWILAMYKGAEFYDPQEAIILAKKACDLTNYEKADSLDTLAVAYAAAGRFYEAVNVAEKALELAESSKQKELATQIRGRLALYKAGQPYIELLPKTSPN